jgi:hypothetical protein
VRHAFWQSLRLRVHGGCQGERQRKPSRQASVDEQIQVILAVLKGKLSLAEAAP